MENFKIFITDLLEKYDKNTETNNLMFKDVHHVQFEVNDTEIEHDKIIFFDINKKKLMEANFEIISNYYSENGIWIWAWSNPSFNKKWVNKSKNLLLYGLKLDSKNFHLKLELINSRFIITDPIQIDIHLAIASELSKNPCIFKIIKDVHNEHTEYENNTDKTNIILIKNPSDKIKYIYYFIFNIKHYN